MNTLVSSRIKRKIRALPPSPGVYLFKGADKKVLYVGKAKSLPKRIESYLRSPATQSLKTQKLTQKIDDIDTIVVNTEVEALLLERSLIKDHAPYFNVLLRDDKHYPYIKADLNKSWPRMEVVRRRRKDGATYLGPFSCVKSMHRVWALVHKVFPLVRCSEYEFSHCKRPCNYYGMGQCWAPCHKDVNEQVYKEMVKDALAFIGGKNSEVLANLKKKMLQAAEDEDYSLAASFRDQIQALKEVSSQEKALATSLEEADVIACELSVDCAKMYVHVLHIREFLIRGGEFFELENPLLEGMEDVLRQFLLQYYERPRELAKVIFMPLSIPDDTSLSQALYKQCSDKQATCISKALAPRFKVPRLKAEKRVMATSQKNCELAIKQKSDATEFAKEYLLKIQEELQLSIPLKRVECIDISHFSGTGTAGSLVVFENGEPNKALYRCYHIPVSSVPSKEGSSEGTMKAMDDYAAIAYVVRKRLAKLDALESKDKLRDTSGGKRSEAYANLPDAIVIDGGKGQLMAAAGVQESEFSHLRVPFFAIAKAKNYKYSKAFKRSADKPVERLFRYGYKHSVHLQPGSVSYKFFSQLRDEAHRFALAHHKKRLKKLRHTSILEDIPGVGCVLRRRLLQKFSSLKNIQSASIEELCKVDGVTQKKAQSIKDFLILR